MAAYGCTADSGEPSRSGFKSTPWFKTVTPAAPAPCGYSAGSSPAILGIAVGIILLLWPLSGVLSLTLILIVFFVIEGIASIMFALEHKRELSEG